jgi:2-polyprenyl-6-hydroxyphenyl methylase/3-demethylubiquinone-9 3-methyltransferase
MRAADAPESTHRAEVELGARFKFGENWTRFLRGLNEERVVAAERSLQDMLGVQRLDGRSFLDIGCGSGLFSLAARRLGAQVLSFDFDPQSVACAQVLRDRYFAGDDRWRICEGSALDESFMMRLGEHDVVYSWGVLHHTGNMYLGLSLAARAVRSGGLAFIAIYNDQGWLSRYWTAVKRLYNGSTAGRVAMIAWHAPYLFAARAAFRLIAGKGRLERGMSIWHDMLDWLGGYPFEVARPEEIFSYFRQRGYSLERVRTCGGRMGCNEFVLRRERAAD